MNRVIAALALSACSIAQAAPPTVSPAPDVGTSAELRPFRLNNPPARTAAEAHSRGQRSIDTVSWWLNGFAPQSARDTIKKAIHKAIAAQRPFMTWTGEGVLLSARVVSRFDPITRLKAWALLGDGLTVSGSGKSAEEALFLSWRRQSNEFSTNPPDGWVVDEEKSLYLWVRQNPQGRLVVEWVPMLDLNNRVRENSAQMELRRLRAKADNLSLWEQVARGANSRIASQEKKKVDRDDTACRR